MENIALILIILILILVFIGVVSLITLIVMAVAKKNMKIPGMITGASFGSALLLFVVLVVMGIIATSGENNSSTETAEEPTPSTTQSNSTTENGTSADAENNDEEFKEEYDKKMSEIRTQREENSEEQTQKELPYQHDVIDGVDVFTSYTEMILTPNVFMSNFSVDMTELLKEKQDEINNGVIFRNATSVTDQHGNEEKMVVLSVWYSQETIEKINYDNWPQLVGEDLYNTADGVLVHHHLKQDAVENKTADDSQPDAHRYGVGTEYTE